MTGFNKNEVLSDLITHITWCLEQYGYLEGEDAKVQSCDQEEHGMDFHPNWSALRTLQNYLYYFIGQPDSKQAGGVAALLIHIINEVFSDLCTDTPWDEKHIISDARKKTHEAIIKLLERFKDALDRSDKNTDQKLWQAFCSFEHEYAQILSHVNEEDMVSVVIA